MNKNKEISEEILIKYVNQGLSAIDFADKLNRSESGVRYYLDKFKLKTNALKSNENLTKEKIQNAVSVCFTYSDVVRMLGYKKVTSGNIDTVKNKIKKYNIDISHFTGRSHGKSKPRKTRPLEEVMVCGSDYNRGPLKKRLLKEGILKNKCEICGIESWNDKNIVMVLDHINGINDDHRLENLRMLCPNCNSQQHTFCRGQYTNFSRCSG